jgi:hypothetical protein
MVVDPAAPLPNMHNPYDADDEEKDDEDVSEINVNAMTQVRGHGNIISVAQMDSVKIANLIVALLHGNVPPITAPQDTNPAQQPHTPPAQTDANSSEQREATRAPRPRHDTYRLRPNRKDARYMPKINVTVNCGATVIGDRNIVGPGLGDIARHMQMAQAQRQQMLQRQQMAAQQQMNAGKAAGVPSPGLGFSIGGHVPIHTPPMSRSSSFGSHGSNGLTRKVEESIEENDAKRACGGRGC